MSASPLRQMILAHLGRFPERVPLMAEFEPAVNMGDYTRTLVTYAVEHGERIGAWLLRPEGAAHQVDGRVSWRSISTPANITLASRSQLA